MSKKKNRVARIKSRMTTSPDMILQEIQRNRPGESCDICHKRKETEKVGVKYLCESCRDGGEISLEDAKKLAREQIARLGDDYLPEDDWYALSINWDLNIWEDGGHRRLTLYPVRNGNTDTRESHNLENE